jgi:hypothetical protein
MMKTSYYYKVVLLFASPWLFPNHAHAQIETSIEQVISSSFKMVLYPTPLKLDTSATEKVVKIIMNQLLISSSSSIAFPRFDAIELLIKGVEFEQHYDLEKNLTSGSINSFTPQDVPASILEFKITVGLHMQDKTSTPPSKFAVDHLVVRAFSQPSTKFVFIELITLTMDPLLVEVEDIDIDIILVQESSNETVVGERASSLSNIDIVLIIVSSLILVGVFYIFIIHCREEGYEGIVEQDSFKWKNTIPVTIDDNRTILVTVDDNGVEETDNIGSTDAEKCQISLGKMLQVKGNIIEAGSLESSVDSQSQIVLSVINESPVMSFASCSSSSRDSTSTSSSTSSSSACISSTEKCRDGSNEVSIVEMADRSKDSESMETKSYHDSKVFTTTKKDNLSSKLLGLPRSDTYTRRLKANAIHSSSASAPIIGRWKNESIFVKKSIRSTHSTASPNCLKLNSNQKTTGLIPLQSFLKNQLVVNDFMMLKTTGEFHNSWLQSKIKALEDIEEGSVDDVFQIDVQQNGDALDESESKKNSASPTPVSEWMKLIRVVNSASETQSSVENSSIEPRSFHARESCSLDLSLEDSLAKSMVDPEVN